MKIKTNYIKSEQPGNLITPIPPGVYDAKVFGMDYGQTSTGTDCLNLEFEILGPCCEGRHVWANLYLTEKASWKFAGFCAAIGIPPTEELETRDILGKTLRIVVKKVESPNGNLRSEVTGFRKSKSVQTPF
jgi:hypothetical protein